MFKKLSWHLKAKYSKKDHLSRQLEIVKVFDIFKDEIKKAFPKEEEIKPVKFKDQVLTVGVRSSVLASELRFRERGLILQINRSLGKAMVKKFLYRF